MLQPTNLPVQKKLIETTKEKGQHAKMARVTEGLTDLDSLNEDQLKQLRMELLESGLNTKLILGKYKEILTKKDVEYRGSDVLKALESVRELWGLKGNTADEVKIRSLVQSKSNGEVTTTLTEVTMKTQDYLNKLKQRELQDASTPEE